MAISRKNIRTALLCEDARLDEQRKPLLIGIYPSKILVGDFPAQILLAAYLEIGFPTIGQHEFFLRMHIGKGSKDVATVALSINIVATEPMPIPVQRLNYRFDEPSDFYMDGSNDGKKWFNIIQRRVDRVSTDPNAFALLFGQSPPAAPAS